MRSSTWDSTGSPQVPPECSSVLLWAVELEHSTVSTQRAVLSLWEPLCPRCSGSAAANDVQINSNRSSAAGGGERQQTCLSLVISNR